LLYQDRLVGNLQNLRINELKSILLYKSDLAIRHGIDINIEVSELIEGLGVSTAIVCQILGIFLDNAEEATVKTAPKKIEIAIIKNPTSKVFILKNSWNKHDVPISKFFEQGYSTNAEGRGIGLYTVQSYIKKIKGLHLETEISDEYFTQILTVKD
jgi:two-component system sensor histidine kinase AgrC